MRQTGSPVFSEESPVDPCTEAGVNSRTRPPGAPGFSGGDCLNVGLLQLSLFQLGGGDTEVGTRDRKLDRQRKTLWCMCYVYVCDVWI